MTESELTEFVRADLEQIGYTTYAEVCVKGGGDIRCDMYARIESPNHKNYGMCIAFEAKLNFNFTVLQQAYGWKNRAHEVYVIVPASYKNMKNRKFARELCRLLGVGVMEVNVHTGQYHVTVKPAFCNNPKFPTLYEEQKMILASNADNKFVTPFKITVQRLNEYMKDKDEEILIAAVKNIKHHYKSTVSGVRTLRLLIERGAIQGYNVVKEDNKLILKKTKTYRIF